MTTTASKGGLRRVAEAKRKRHAQREPLPEKIVEISPDVYADWKLNELRAEARRRGVEGQEKMGKTDLQQALVLKDKEEAEAPRPAPRSRPPAQKAPAKGSSSNGELPAPGTRSEIKAQALGRDLVALGWAVEYRTEGELTEMTATRSGDAIEVIHQAWDGGVYVNAAATYTVGDRTVQTRNASAARKYAERSATDAAAELNRVATNKAFRRRDAEELPKVVRLPFDPRTAPEKDVVDALRGQAVKWHNRFSGKTESALMPAWERGIRIEEQKGERVALFCCQAGTGFRAFRLTALVAVGRAKRFTAGQQRQHETVLVDVE